MWFNSLQGIGDVSKVTPSNLDLLRYNDTTKIWELVQLSAIETDPIFSAWAASYDNHANWDTAYGWGNHAGLYEPVFGFSTYLDQAVKTISDVTFAKINANGEVRIAYATGNSLVKIEQLMDWPTGGYDNYALEVIGYSILGGIRLNGIDGDNALYSPGSVLGFTVDDGYEISFGHWISPNKRKAIVIDGSGNTTLLNGYLVASLGTEKAPALSTGNWTLGTGWRYLTSPNRLDKNVDGTGTATPTATTNIVAGTTYKVIITVDSISGDELRFTLGAVQGNNISTTGTFTEYITARTTGKIIFTPNATGLRVTISAISIIPLDDAIGDLTIDGNLSVKSPVTFSSKLTTQGIEVGNNEYCAFLKSDGTDDGTRLYKSTANGMQFNYATNAFIYQAVDDKNIYYRNSGGTSYVTFNPLTQRVGIGTDAPAMPLHMYNSSVGDGANERLRIQNNGGAVFDLIAYGATNSSYPHLAGNAFLNASTGNLLIMANGLNSFMALFSGGFATTNERLRILNTGEIGIGTTVPLRALDINHATGNCLRLIYNDSNGSASYYADFLMGSSGDLTIQASGGDISLDDENLTTTGIITGGGYSVGAAAGIDATIPVAPVAPATIAGSMTFTKGILTAYTAPS